MLEKEFNYFLEHQDELVALYNGKYIVIKNQTVLGNYSSKKEAVAATIKEHEIGTFLVQLCTPGSESYTQTYHSRVSFA
ncbi:MAG: hypothetical protein HQK92_01580 [Nitrospirae bacterium]|nr:hypothetical protein [Nitrospirota bacterium]